MYQACKHFLVGLLGLSLVACSDGPVSRMDHTNSELVAQGKALYQQHCASCHGGNLEGQPDWRKRGEDGRLPAPPHDDSGHTWHHPDKVLFEIVKRGMVPPYAPEHYVSDMQSWAGTLSDDQIWAVLTYIKSRWSDENRLVQKGIDERARAQE